MRFEWDESKNEKLKSERNISFERIVVAIDSGHLVDVLDHHNQKKYSSQILVLVNIDSYIWVVPTHIGDDVFNLITAFPSRKFTEIYLSEARK